MKKIKVSEAAGPVLDWMVAKCEWHNAGTGAPLPDEEITDLLNNEELDTSYSTDWAQGGPIKTDNRISTQKKHDGWWLACIYDLNDEMTFVQLDHDELIAAMRCYVASKLGDEVEVPEELA